jgi:hypothetical protein
LTYQFVVQFPSLVVDYDDLIAIEDGLSDALGPSANVDGHDFGQNEGNIFIFTDKPEHILEGVLRLLRGRSCDGDATVAYRTVGGEEYTVVWPHGYKGRFSIA